MNGSASVVIPKAVVTRSRTGRVIAIVLAAIFVIGVARPSYAAPARSGTIIGGYYPGIVLLAPGPGPDCRTNADCAPWLLAGCPSQMAGIDPAVHTSIVDVRSLAGSRKRWAFAVQTSAPRILFVGVSVQLWTSSCEEIFQIGGDFRTAIEDGARFKIPRNAKWMTVASVDTPPLTWSLR